MMNGCKKLRNAETITQTLFLFLPYMKSSRICLSGDTVTYLIIYEKERSFRWKK